LTYRAACAPSSVNVGGMRMSRTTRSGRRSTTARRRPPASPTEATTSCPALANSRPRPSRRSTARWHDWRRFSPLAIGGLRRPRFVCVLLLAALLAWLPRTDLALSAALAALGTVQIALAGSTRWVGGLHPLLALVVLGLAATLASRARLRRRSGSV
jgi:hypothetical protein